MEGKMGSSCSCEVVFEGLQKLKPLHASDQSRLEWLSTQGILAWITSATALLVCQDPNCPIEK